MQNISAHYAGDNATLLRPDLETLETGLTLEALTRLDFGQLAEYYRTGCVSSSLRSLDGDPAGRMLAVAGKMGRGLRAAVIRRVAASRVFPWRGKTFTAIEDTCGEGINRVRVLGQMFRFETRVEPSVLDGRPCILLDYDKPDNPWFIRLIRDELREVAVDLFLGPALLRTRHAHRLLLFFAVDARPMGRELFAGLS